MARPGRSSSTIRSISWKYSSRMVSRGLCRNETADAGAQVLQNEVLLGGGLAVIDLLGPLLEGQLDPERLVDGECNVEEIEAVDPEIVDGVALQLDLVARYVAGLGDDGSHRIEGVHPVGVVVAVICF